MTADCYAISTTERFQSLSFLVRHIFTRCFKTNIAGEYYTKQEWSLDILAHNMTTQKPRLYTDA